MCPEPASGLGPPSNKLGNYCVLQQLVPAQLVTETEATAHSAHFTACALCYQISVPSAAQGVGDA